MKASSLFMKTHYADLDQPDAISVQLEFIGKSAVGAAKVVVKALKIGKRISVISVSLLQGSRLNITGYITHSNISTEEGETLTTTGWNREHLQIPDVKDCDLNLGAEDASLSFRPATGKLDYSYPPGAFYGRTSEAVCQQWVRWGELEGGSQTGFTVDHLGFVVDMYVPLPAVHPDQKSTTPMWCPTVNLQLEVKRAPPPGGWKWLFVEVRSEVILNGRHDVRVVIRDENKEIVAIGGQMGLILSFERNMGNAKL